MSEINDNSKIKTAAEKTVEMIRSIANEEIDKAEEARRTAFDNAIKEIESARSGTRSESSSTAATKQDLAAQEPNLTNGFKPIVLGDQLNCLPKLLDLVFWGGFSSQLLDRINDVRHSSPVVAESEAVTSDAPAMTVQENTGAGAVSPSAPAQPRFVAVGGYVYDRELDRTLVTTDSGLFPALVIARLNAGHLDANTLLWEEAK
ncbi:hypothetical protein ICM05_09680 [Leucobacter sp. cx-42]|uniref:hypothetical protein n=1 Tax=unclassified Leucobacter TaxID=2621730 RepID=UPI00165E722D|nr:MULTISPECIES: hypothetical protein [unclassified Leucobacter]MBC9954907.1 hypothetical protein [Leucobacter sp. cx-42]